MLRTNSNLLSYIEHVFQNQKKDVFLKEYPKASFIFKQDEATRKIAIIKKGFVKCYFSEENGKDFIVEFLGKGEIIGEIEAIRNINCLCNIEALSDVQVYYFSTNFFQSIIQSDPQFNLLLIDELAGRIINTSSRASFQQLYSLKHGLSKLLILQEKQNVELSKTDMAAYLGIDIRSLNRLLKDLNATK